MRTCTRRTGGPGDVGVAGQTPASTIHAEERARHALARTVTQYAARSWLPVASTIRACTQATAAPGAQAPRASSTIRAFTHTATYVPARPHHRRSSTIRTLAYAATLGCGGSDTTAAAQSTLLRTRQPHQSRQSAALHQHNPRVCAHSNLRASSATSSAFKHNPLTCARGNRTGPANPPLAISTIRTSARAATYVPTRPRHRRSSTIHALARGNRTSPANPLLGISTIRAYARTAARAARR